MVISRGGFQVRNHTLVKVTTDEGITGLGEGIGNAKLVAAILNAQMCNQVIGLDPFNIEFIRSKLIDSEVYFERKGSAICAASAIEMACWDIKGKKLGVPVYQLLGGRYQDRLKAYASDIYWEEDPIKMAKNAERIVDAGFKVVKAHIGYKSPAEDLIRVKRIREAIGENIGLMIDLNGGYSAFDACHAARLWETYNLTWLEEPINPNHLDALKDLRSKISIPIAAGENEFRIFGFKDLFENKAVDIAMPDIGRVGGLQETKNICVLADAYGIQVSPHNFSSGVLLAATLHLMASTPNTTLLEVDTSKNAVYQELLVEPLEFNDGYFTVPEGPGLGVEISPEILKKYQVTSF
jgi:L-alanine-DL-glutamate epimerase-like enolase superfamily enzyme|tara:strand:- start:5652 stop:6707 length:1056 start_codon:yes stop_codon:yes gene_type:complete